MASWWRRVEELLACVRSTVLAATEDAQRLSAWTRRSLYRSAEALLPRMNAGAPTELHSHFLTKPLMRSFLVCGGLFTERQARTWLPDGWRYNVKRTGGTPALRKGSLGLNEVRGLIVRLASIASQDTRITGHESRVTGFLVCRFLCIRRSAGRRRRWSLGRRRLGRGGICLGGP
jgi:hypothetical protein